VTGKEAALAILLAELGPVAVAVSGGVDSMTLAHLVRRHHRAEARMVHAVSPAVPAAASERVRVHARRDGWALSVIDAGEFADARYRANPANRCYFCKANLYGKIAARFAGTILSGTNTDDLADWRPGLKAAAEHGVRHPFVEAGVSKAEIRDLARGLRLDDIAELPAAPCLSSRVETGIGIDPGDLALVETVEERLRAALGPLDLRCRIARGGVRIEIAAEALQRMLSPAEAETRATIEAAIAAAGRGFLGYATYRRGSAFLWRGVHA
jgi:uncharacterized protein